MNVLAEVIDESITGMEGGLVSKAEQEKVCRVSGSIPAWKIVPFAPLISPATLYAKSRFRTAEIRTAVAREKRPDICAVRERSADGRRGETQAASAGGDHSDAGGCAAGP